MGMAMEEAPFVKAAGPYPAGMVLQKKLAEEKRLAS